MAAVRNGEHCVIPKQSARATTAFDPPEAFELLQSSRPQAQKQTSHRTASDFRGLSLTGAGRRLLGAAVGGGLNKYDLGRGLAPVDRHGLTNADQKFLQIVDR